MIDYARFIQSLIDDGVIPGMTMLAGKKDRIAYQREYGYFSAEPEKIPVPRDAMYDLASLTKPLVTALLTVMILERENISPNTPARKFIPALPHDYTLENLLIHNSGLPAWYPFYLYPEPLDAQIAKLTHVGRSNRKVEYSCVGYLLLHDILGRIAGKPFTQCVREMIIEPVGLTRTFVNVPEHLKNLCAPTEIGNEYEKRMAMKEHPEAAERLHWRTELIRGETHDCNSYYLGGCAGNAGLFASANDVFTLSRQFYPEMTTLLKPESCRSFWRNLTRFRNSSRSYGFKLNSSAISCGGRAIASNAIGHSGFTGTSLWLEPGDGHTFIILTNRVHPHVEKSTTRGNINFNKVRRRLHRFMRDELGKTG